VSERKPTPNGRVTTWNELRSLIHPWRWLVVLIGGCVLLSQTFAVVPPLLMQRIIDDHLTTGVSNGLFSLALLYLGATAAAAGIDFAVTYLTAFVAQNALRDLRVRLFDHLERLPLSYYDRTPVGDAISRCTADVDTVDTLFSTGVASLITRMVQLATSFVAMAVLSPRLSLLALFVLPALVKVTRFFQVHIRGAERERRQAISLVNVYLQETLSGVEVVRAFAREESFVARFRRALRGTVVAYAHALSYNVFYSPMLTVLVALCVAGLLWVGTGGVSQSWGLTMGTLIAFVLLFQRFFEPVRNLGEDWQTVQSALSGVERVIQVLQMPIEKPAPAQTIVAEPGTPSDDTLVEMHDVVFGYAPERPVLHKIRLAVRAGEHIALVGRTGAGKSSIVRLLGGLYEPWAGRIRVAGLNPRSLSEEERRRTISVVPQTVQLFSGTVWDNLTMGDTAVPREAVERAARMTSVDHFASVLPQGYDTLLSGVGRGEGVQLSGGQLQLLSLARALVWDPTVLLLDEATAAIDSASEAEFRAALRTAIESDGGRQRAVVTIAHRLSTAREADRVVVIENGRIIEEGPPSDLIHRGGRFAAMVELENAGWDWRASA